MATELKEMIREALELSDEDRAMLAALLLKSLEPDQESDPNVEAAWAAEAERRWNEIESGAVKTIPWEEVKTRIFRQ